MSSVEIRLYSSLTDEGTLLGRISPGNRCFVGPIQPWVDKTAHLIISEQDKATVFRSRADVDAFSLNIESDIKNFEHVKDLEDGKSWKPPTGQISLIGFTHRKAA